MDDRRPNCDHRGMVDEQLIGEMQRLRDELRAAKANGAIDYQALSLSLGKNPTYIQQFVTKGTPRILHAHIADEVRKALAPHRAADRSGGKVSGRAEIIALLRKIDNLPEAALEPIYGVIEGFLKAGASQKQIRHRDQSEPANRHHESEPSR